MNILLKKATEADVEGIYNLYIKYFGNNLTLDFFKKKYLNFWKSDEDYFGYVLYDNNKPIAFCAYIFYTRIINDKKEKFCNFSSWVVDADYRKVYKLEVLKPLFKLAEEGYTLVGLNPTSGAYKAEKALGFKDLETGRFTIPVNFLQFKIKKAKQVKLFHNDFILKELKNINLKKIHEDHLFFSNLNRLLIKINGIEIYIIYNFLKKKKLFKIMNIHYISNTEIFFKNIYIILTALFLKTKTFGIVIESRFLSDNNKIIKFYEQYKQPHIYLSNSLKGEEIDLLYTERFLIYHLNK